MLHLRQALKRNTLRLFGGVCLALAMTSASPAPDLSTFIINEPPEAVGFEFSNALPNPDPAEYQFARTGIRSLYTFEAETYLPPNSLGPNGEESIFRVNVPLMVCAMECQAQQQCMAFNYIPQIRGCMPLTYRGEPGSRRGKRAGIMNSDYGTLHIELYEKILPGDAEIAAQNALSDARKAELEVQIAVMVQVWEAQKAINDAERQAAADQAEYERQLAQSQQYQDQQQDQHAGVEQDTQIATLEQQPYQVCVNHVQSPNPWLNGAQYTYDPTIMSAVCAGTETRTDAAQCFQYVTSGQVAWDKQGLFGAKPNAYTAWNPQNIVTLCRGAQPDRGVTLVQCFEQLLATGTPWDSAVYTCRNGMALD